jgi:hypothetical protein
MIHRTFDTLSQNNPDNKTYKNVNSISLSFFLIIIDFSFLLIWVGIYSSTKVLLLLNRLIKNSE